MTQKQKTSRRPQSEPREDGPGSGARRLAFEAVEEVLRSRRSLDDIWDGAARAAGLEPRDEALAKAIVLTTFRRLGTIRAALAARRDGGLPRDERLFALLATGAAQILFLDVPDHAAVSTAVDVTREDRRLTRYGGLVNALLRRVARERDAILAEADPMADVPDWLAARWRAAYGDAGAQAIAAAHRQEAALDITPKPGSDAAALADSVGAVLLPTGSLRLLARTPVRELPGYQDGAWWVQDAAAALPARLLAVQPGERVADLCAAPGGKTAQLAAAGARVVAVDRSAKRLERLQENLARLGLDAEVRAVDALALPDETFDAVLLDAPCSATGTLRRHPDVAWSKGPEDIAKLTALQARLLDKAASLVNSGGRIVYCTCSLEPEEGERQADAFLARHPEFERGPIAPGETGGLPELIDARGDLRTLPHALALDTGRSGMDGFFAARFVRRGD